MRLTKNSLRQMIMSEITRQTSKSKINEEVTADLASMDMILSNIIDEFERAFELIEAGDEVGEIKTGLKMAWAAHQELVDVSESLRNMAEVSPAPDGEY